MEANERCLNPRGNRWPSYGGRGIRICERWLDFKNFLADMGERPKGLSIERIDNDGNYEPGNCRYASNKEQSSNRRSNAIINYDGISLTRRQWEEKLSLPKGILYKRIKRGWPIEKALSTQSSTKRRKPLVNTLPQGTS